MCRLRTPLHPQPRSSPHSPGGPGTVPVAAGRIEPLVAHALLGLTCSNTLHVIPHEVLLPKQRLSHSQEMGGKPGWQQGMGRERRRGPAAATQPLGTERWHLEQSHTRGTLHPDGDEHHQANSYNGSRRTQCPTLRVSPKLSTYCWQQPKREKKNLFGDRNRASGGNAPSCAILSSSLLQQRRSGNALPAT